MSHLYLRPEIVHRALRQASEPQWVTTIYKQLRKWSLYWERTWRNKSCHHMRLERCLKKRLRRETRSWWTKKSTNWKSTPIEFHPTLPMLPMDIKALTGKPVEWQTSVRKTSKKRTKLIKCLHGTMRTQIWIGPQHNRGQACITQRIQLSTKFIGRQDTDSSVNWFWLIDFFCIFLDFWLFQID